MRHRDVLANSLFVDYSQISNNQPGVNLTGVEKMGVELRLGSKTEGKDVSWSRWWDAKYDGARMIDQ